MIDAKRFVYQLVATGSYQCFGGRARITSSTVFRTEEAARRRIDKFTEIVTDPDSLKAIEPNGLKVEVKPLEVIDE